MPPLFFAWAILFISGCFSGSVTGPINTVREPVDGSFSVICNYTKEHQDNRKYWCRGSDFSSCEKVIHTTNSAPSLTEGRVSLSDNRTHHMFTVITKNLTLEDTGMYWCGIDIPYRSDDSFSVTVEVFKEPTTTITVTTGSVSTVSSTMPSSTAMPTTNTSSLLMIMLPVVFLVLVAFLVGALLLMWRLKKQKAANASGEILLSMAASSTGNDVFNAAVKPTPKPSQKPALPCSDQATNNMAEVEYTAVKKASHLSPQLQVPTNTAEGVSYATLRFPVQNEQAIYANVE